MSLDISFIVCGRNDNYGGYLMDRFNKFINCISILSDKYKIKSEIIFVDWNPIEGKPMWKEVLDTNDIFQKYNQMITFITVPYEEHIKYKNRSPHPLPVLDYLGRNVGIRRSRGKFILTSSPDLIFTDDFFIKIKQGLDPKYVYRAVRYDYKRIDKQFNNYEEYKNFISECDKRVFEKNIEHDMTFTNDRILCDHIFANASGDFLLASREIWNSIKGCSEITDMFSHLDTGTLRKLVTQGEQWILPLSCVIYHQDHERPHIGKSNDYVSLYENDNNWGLNNIELKSITFNVIYETLQ